MAMNWCDSSDEEDEAFFAPANNPPIVSTSIPPEESIPEAAPPVQVVGGATEDPPQTTPSTTVAPNRPRKEFQLPTQPPYTAFVGNLAFSIRNPQQLADAISDLVRERFETEIVIKSQRVAMDRQSNIIKPKGFGYVEVETLDQLKAVLRLDDGQSMIAGRCIHLDVAQPASKGLSRQSSRTSSSLGTGETANATGNNIDGSKFQGGRYNREGSGSLRRNESEGSYRRKDSAGSFRRSESTGASASTSNGQPMGERPSLKLQPRSQTVGAISTASPTTTNTAGSIFGGAKPRDHESWERERSATTGASATVDDVKTSAGSSGDNKKPRGNNNLGRSIGRAEGKEGSGHGRADGRGGNRGETGGSSGGRDSGRPRNDRRATRQSSAGKVGGTTVATKNEPRKKEESSSKTTPPPGPIVTEPDKTSGSKAVSNKFAALHFDDSDEE